MTTPEQNLPPDELVYQSNKQEPDIKKVYDNQPEGTDAAAGNLNQPEIAPGVTQDEASAESFPASDPPATMSSIPAPHIPEESGTSNQD
jgi:hypothetical protein